VKAKMAGKLAPRLTTQHTTQTTKPPKPNATTKIMTVMAASMKALQVVRKAALLTMTVLSHFQHAGRENAINFARQVLFAVMITDASKGTASLA
jgi:hypothetical protein